MTTDRSSRAQQSARGLRYAIVVISGRAIDGSSRRAGAMVGGGGKNQVLRKSVYRVVWQMNVGGMR